MKGGGSDNPSIGAKDLTVDPWADETGERGNEGGDISGLTEPSHSFSCYQKILKMFSPHKLIVHENMSTTVSFLRLNLL